MEQEQILETLTTQLGQTSLSERTIREYVAENLPEEGSDFDFAKHAKILRSLNGNFSHDVAAKVEEFKKNYKPQPLEEPKKKEDDQQTSEIQKLLTRIEALEKGSKESSESIRKSEIRNRVEALKDSLKVHNKNLWKDCVAQVNIGDDDNQDKVLEKVKSSYEKKLKDYFGEGATPYGGKSLEQSEAEKEKVKNAQEGFKARMKARGRL